MKRVLLYLLLSTILFSCGEIEDVQYVGISNVSNVQHQDQKYSAVVNATLNNPNHFPIVVKPCNLEVYLGEQKLGKLYLNKKVKLNKNTESSYPVDISFAPEKLNLLSLASLALSKEKTTLHFVGDVRAGNGFFSKKFKVNKRKNIDLSGLLKSLNLDLGDFMNGKKN